MRNWNNIGAAILALALVMPAGLVMADSKDHDGKDHQVSLPSIWLTDQKNGSADRQSRH